MDDENDVEPCRGHTYFNNTKFSFVWEIHNFLSCDLSSNLESPHFQDPNNKCIWSLILEYKVSTFHFGTEKYLILHLYNQDSFDCLKDKQFNFEFYIIDNKMQKQCRQSLEKPVDSCKDGLKILYHDCNEIVTMYLQDNNLVFQINLRVKEKKNISIINHPLLYKNTILEDLEHLFNSKELADVILAVDKDQLYAHKAILAARSEVFLAMFKNTTIEKLNNKVNIIDFDIEVVDEMLYFMYTGKTRFLDKLANTLLTIADKYNIQELKKICEQSLFSKINISTVLEILIFADQHNCFELKKQACNFIALHIKDVIHSEEYKKWKTLYPQLFIDVLANSLGIKEL